MKKIYLSFLVLLLIFEAEAQNNVGIGTTSPSPRTILHLENSGSPLGLLLPNVDFTTLTPLAAEEGMMIYDHTRNSIFFWNGSSWDPVVPGWTLNGNTGTNSGINFIGTTDAQDLTFRTNNIEKIRLTQQGQLEFLNTGGSIFMGQGAGANDDLTLKNNVFIGPSAGFSNISGGFNVGIGGSALLNNINGSQNTAVGDGALLLNTSGGQNTAIGLGALFNNINGSTNVAVGLNALFTAPSSSANVAIGYEAMLVNTNSNNTAVGFRAMQQNTSGGLNVAIGSSSLTNNTTGSQNTSVGQSALATNTDGALNTAMGQAALISNTSGSGNTGIGLYALDLNTIGGNNTAVGMQSAFGNTTGGGNVAMGFNALASNTTGSNNTAIGNTADVDVNNLTNATMIGAGARAGVSNSVILGDPNVRVGIGTSIPLGVLHIEDADWNSNSVILNSNGLVGSTIRFQNSTAGNHVYDIIGSTGTGALTGAGFFGIYDNTGLAYRLVISPVGNVGIGVNAPLDRLQIATANSSIRMGTWASGASYNVIDLKGSNGTDYNLLSSSVDPNLYINRPTGQDIRFRMNNADQMILNSSGNVGIGTASPSTWGKLHVAAGSYAVDGTNTQGIKWVSGNTLQADMFRWGLSNNALYVTNNGTSNLTGVYLSPGATNWTSSSDIRLKENIVESSYGLNEILRLSPKEYNFITTENKDKRIGFLAQDVYQIIPEIVQKGDDGEYRGEGNAKKSADLGFKPWGINYTELVPVLVKAVQELNAQNEALLKRIEVLESK